MVGLLKPDAGAMRAQLDFLFEEAREGLVEIKYEDPATHKLNRWMRFPPEHLSDAVACAFAASKAGSRVYFGAGLRKEGMGSQASKSSDVLAWPALCWDFDSQEASEYGLEIASHVGLPFHLVVRTGSSRNHGESDLRLQCWTKLSEPCADLSRVQRSLKIGIGLLRSDTSIHDAVRVMRLAGSIAWARKDGRVDEPTGIELGKMDGGNPLRIEEVERILGAAPIVPTKAKRKAKKAKPIDMQNLPEASADIWRSSPDTDRAVDDLIHGVEMNPNATALVQKLVRDGVEAPRIAAAINGLYDKAAELSGRPERVEELRGQLPDLVGRMVDNMGQREPYKPATEDMEASTEVIPPDARECMLRDNVYVEHIDRMVRLDNGAALNKSRFDARYVEVFPYGRKEKSPWTIAMNDGRRQFADGLTFRPHQPLFVKETYVGLCLNRWRPLPAVLTDEEQALVDDTTVAPFLEHAAVVIPDEVERGIVLDWMAWVVQHQDEKPNWCIVLGSTREGVGKDLLLEPLRAAIGEPYIREIGARELTGAFTGWRVNCKLVIVQEMENFERRMAHNTLKPLISSPPATLRVNEKGIPQYDVPNIVACIFMTNEEDAIAISRGDRRYFVSWNHDDPLPAEHFQAYADWLKAGGAAATAVWLARRPLSAEFCAQVKGVAPMTGSKEEMRKATRSGLLEWIEDGIEGEVAPFDADLICVEDARARIPASALGRGGVRPTQQAFALALRKAGCRPVGPPQMRMGRPTEYTTDDRMRLMTVRRHEMYGQADTDRLRELFWRQHETTPALNLDHGRQALA